MRRTFATMTALLAALPLLAACTSGPSSSADKPTETSAAPTDQATSRPATEIALPADEEAWNATSSYPPSTVTLTVGQRFGVKGTVSARQGAWSLSEAGNGTVLRRGPDVTVDGGTDPVPVPGSAWTVDQTFVALAPGITTLTWVFHHRGICGPAVPTSSPASGCGRVSKSIQVTVR